MISPIAKALPFACLFVGVSNLLAIDLVFGPRAIAGGVRSDGDHITAAKGLGPDPRVAATTAIAATATGAGITTTGATGTSTDVAPAGEANAGTPAPAVGAAARADEASPKGPGAAAPAAVGTAEVIAHFKTSESTAESDEALRAIASQLDANPRATILVEGHADRRGAPQLNRELSLRRAAWARDRLIQLGIDERRIRVAGHGASRPARAGDDAASLAANRRVEARISER